MRALLRPVALGLVVIACLSGTTAASPSAVGAAGCEGWSGAQPLGDRANGVAVVSACRAWLVGTDIEQWNGFAWYPQTLSAPAGSTGYGLQGVAATSASNAWAAGFAVVGGVFQTLIQHWDGHAWSIQPSKNVGTGANTLAGLAATSATDAWAVGNYASGTTQEPLIEHWNGSSWKRSALPPLPTGATGGLLTAVTATSASNAWAVGATRYGSGDQSLILHWNGRVWAREPSPNPGGTGAAAFTFPSSVIATSATNAWAVGVWFDTARLKYRTLVLRWAGSSWKMQKAPSTPDQSNYLYGVTAESRSSAWAVGSHQALVSGVYQPLQTLIEHWDGTRWSIVPSPDPGGAAANNQLLAVAARPGVTPWAVGWHETSTNPEQELALHCC
jgi:hypothetical protein